jgi:ubiquinone/menaquinone biosynthesis C-methylase UbiE
MPIQKDPEGMEMYHLEKEVKFTNRHVLEIGCGDGRLTWRYAPSAGRVTGIDLDMVALHAAVTTCLGGFRKTISFLRASSIFLPFPPNKFDITILAWAL